MDIGTEYQLINKHTRERNEDAGEYVMWYQFSPSTTVWDDLYDEGPVGVDGRQYLSPLKVPTIYVDEREDLFTLREEGRQPTQHTDFTILLRDAEAAGILNPREYNAHLNDLLFYEQRLYKVREYRVSGRLQQDEVAIWIVTYEVFEDQEFSFDPDVDTSVDDPWPSALPSV